jgi:predicted transport protein
MSDEQAARQMWRFSREEMARGTLDTLGERTFTDGRVRKAIQVLISDPPRTLLNLLRTAMGDDRLRPQKIKESLFRIAGEADPGHTGLTSANAERNVETPGPPKARTLGARKAWVTRRAARGAGNYTEDDHLRDKPQEVASLFHMLDGFCLSLAPPRVLRVCLAYRISYLYEGRCFCSVNVRRSRLRVWIRTKLSEIDDPPPFAQDMAEVGRWRPGPVVLHVSNRSELGRATELVRQSFEGVV